MKELSKRIQDLSNRLIALLESSDQEDLTDQELQLYIEFEELIKKQKETRENNDNNERAK